MRIAIVNGHPDAQGVHFCTALADAYAEGARSAGHEVSRIDVSQLEFPLLRSKLEWETAALPPALLTAQKAIGRAHHLVLVFPLWLGDMPALLKAFLEQVMRPGFAITKDEPSVWRKLLTGKTARVVITMGMPALVYRLYFRAYALRLLKRNILGFVGIKVVGDVVVGNIETMTDRQRTACLARMQGWGRCAR